MAYMVSKEVFENILQAALAGLPDRFAKALEVVRIEVRPRPTRKMLGQLGIPEDELLLGLYNGRPITERSVEEPMAMPEVIYLFKEDIEDACDTQEELQQEIRRTVLHELGHHFGLNEQNLEDLGYE